MKKIDQYENYTTDDFLQDHHFRQWVRNEPRADHAFWEAFLKTYPHKRETLEEAAALYRAIHQQFDAEISDKEIRASFERTKAKALAAAPPRQKTMEWWKIAAGLLLLLGFFVFLFPKNDPQPLTYRTDYGEKKEILLPDSTVVVLNAKASITLRGDWQTGQTRALDLEGEAYFKVKKDLQTHAKFVVHTAGLDVQVYGTQFNVYTRGDLTEVALDEGSIMLAYDGNQNQQDSLLLTPGDMISYQKEEKAIVLQKNQTNEHSSWKDGTLFFTKKPLAFILQKMSEIYGLEFQIDQQVVNTDRVTGGIPIEDLPLALETISTLYDLEVEKREELYFIKSR